MKVDFRTIAPYVRFVQEYHGYDDYRIQPRVIYDHEIIFVKKGKCMYRIGEQMYSLRGGDVHFMPPNVLHSCYVPKGEEFAYFAVHFDLAYMGEKLDFSANDVYVLLYGELDEVPYDEELAGRPTLEFREVQFPFVMAAGDTIAIHDAFQRMLTAYVAKRFGYEMELRAYLLLILARMTASITNKAGISKEHAQGDKIAAAMRYMEQRYEEQVDLQRLAQEAGMSPSYFRALFKGATGRTPLEYLTAVRMERAKALLLEGDYLIHDISARVGYADIHYFSNLFKKIEGLSPRNYRLSVQRGADS
ncbi:AraC family transcriptional regulator [Paenibacillus sp. BC26]|uniref:AraC family transcriptional regulator n=1 Tax=Paenibacillus sp. BC26 TaxID=1881032 RepID=UPI0008ECF548|nr:AraC family transcriptional regulator [Paenibacillus sp. BC26]SFS65808.1 AraC-type DNA-binding protein [Paenibacillus sp. BC26]